MNWYEFTPVDTLFFKGASPMLKGKNHSASTQFPPAPETISGAVRTTILRQQGLSPADYKNGKGSKELSEAIGAASTPPPFYISGPLFKSGSDIFIPVPYLWFTDEKKSDTEKDEQTLVYKARFDQSDLIQTSSENLIWAVGQSNELKPLGGNWVKISEFTSANPKIYKTKDFYGEEIRTGIELEEENRRVKKGHLYSFIHTRLKEGVSLVFGIDRQLPLADQGILMLGGEKRFGQYQKINTVHLPESAGNYFMALCPVETNLLAQNSAIAVGKIIYRGGWDLAKGFHKPMKGYYPAGSVFNNNIDQNCIQL
jgi:CRISPR-associated protein Cmr3